MSTNPLINASWGQQNQQQQNPFNMGGLTGDPNIFGRPSGGVGNPGGYSNPRGDKEVQRNLGMENILSAQMKNQMAPQWAQLFGQYGQGAGNFFKQLTDQGSPYYKQKQAEAFTQGNKANQDAAAMARQELDAKGYGYTPSGANAAMMGGMAMQGAQNQAEAYLQNLFQNEQMQLAGAQGAESIGQMFNPAQILGGNPMTAIEANPSFGQSFNQITSGIGNLFSGGSALYKAARGPQ